MSTQTEPKLVTQIDFARAGQITPQMKEVAEREHRDPEYIRERVADGRIAIPANIVHIKKGMRAFGVGEGLSTKVNVNLGISGDKADAAEEWKKVKIAEDFGADAIMDLSNSGKTRQFRQQLIDETPLMVGTVPMYDAIGYMEKPLVKLTKDDLFEVVRAHAEDGVDFMTIHCGINKSVTKTFKETGRLMNIVSRGGSLLFGWMEVTGNENPFYEFYDELLEICHEYDVTISFGDSCRPGCLYDSNDATETAEMIELGKLCKRAWAAGVQVMVEGPGHMALDEIAANMKLQKRLCHNAPFYVLGPTSTIDADCPTGASIPIEQRDPAEVTEAHYAQRMAPRNVKVYNPAFDVTPCDLITAIVTERGIARPPFDDALRAWSLPGRAGR